MSDRRRHAIPVRAAGLLIVAALVGSACSRSPALPGAANPADVVGGDPVAGGGPCGLLDVQALELALNVTLAGTATASQVRPAIAGMDMCGVRADRSSAAWGVLATAASERFREYKKWNGAYLEGRTVGGHQAVWDGRLHTLVVLDGARAFAVRLTVAHPPLRKGADVDSYVAQAASRLATQALGRLHR